MIEYLSSIEGVSENHLNGFFVGWKSAPTAATLLKILQGSNHVVLAIDEETRNVVGFVTALSDGVLSAYLPLLEVLPAYQHKGIGSELVSRMLKQLGDLYMIDLSCDEDMQPFYEKFGMHKSHGMMLRNYGQNV